MEILRDYILQHITRIAIAFLFCPQNTLEIGTEELPTWAAFIQALLLSFEPVGITVTARVVKLFALSGDGVIKVVWEASTAFARRNRK